MDCVDESVMGCRLGGRINELDQGLANTAGCHQLRLALLPDAVSGEVVVSARRKTLAIIINNL
jgi:hypothetical protein